MADSSAAADQPSESPAAATPDSSTLSVNSISSALQSMSFEERFQLVRGVGEHCVGEQELQELLQKKKTPICYDGLEPSGRMHIGQGLLKILNVNRLVRAGCKVKIWIADWFAQLNNKLNGDLKKIQTVGRYFIEIWKAAGMETEGVEFLWCSEEINKRPDEYWSLVMDIARQNTLTRVRRCCKIMGLSEEDELNAGHIFYICMQCADALFLEADICHLGMDQLEVNVLAREYCDFQRTNKPIILSHHMLPDLLEGPSKMSKDNPSSTIFMDDDEAEVNVKIKKAFCPPKIVEGNPCIEVIQHIVFAWCNKFEIPREVKNGGNKLYTSLEELLADYSSGELHPADLKPALAKAVNDILQPVRKHLRENPQARDLSKAVKAYKQTSNLKSVAGAPVDSGVAPAAASNGADAGQAPLLSATGEVPGLSTQLLDSIASAFPSMSLGARFQLVRRVGEECIQDQELQQLLQKKLTPICYDGFEPSGRMHIAQGVMKIINVNKLVKAGCRVKIWIADWFAQLNNKMNGDLMKIQTVGHYFIEIWKAGRMDTTGVEFLWCSEEINKQAGKYWTLVMEIARRNSLTRIKRCCQIMGRNEEDELTAAQIFYPCMQCADIFFLEADICQLGMDQRKVNVLAREFCDVIKRKNKPIILSHHMLPGLLEGQQKMSKSNPGSAIFMEDEEADVNLKISNSFCPPKIVEGNPCIEYIKYIVLPWFNKFEVPRQDGNKLYSSMEELIADYNSGELHPDSLKPALAKAINEILEPIRDHFRKNAHARDLFEAVKAYRVSR